MKRVVVLIACAERLILDGELGGDFFLATRVGLIQFCNEDMMKGYGTTWRENEHE